MSAEEFAGAFERDGQVFVVYDDDTEARIDPVLIREAGWKPDDENDPCEEDHCGTDYCSCGTIRAEALAVLTNWHNANHVGAYRFCDSEPCRDLRAV